MESDNHRCGKTSDHSVAIAVPLSVSSGVSREYREISYRPTPDSSRALFENMLLEVSWDRVYQNTDIDEKINTFDNIIKEMVYISFPTVKLRVNNQDLPHITAEIKVL